MKILILYLIVSFNLCYSQTYEIDKLSGDVKILTGISNNWQDLKQNLKLTSNSIISTGKNSFVKIKGPDIIFTLNESSAISVSNIKKMSLDDLILALAMEDVINAPRNNSNEKSDNTGVYGNKENNELPLTIKSNDFGFKRLNGAKQLAENGMKESAIITAKETYRKYPDTKKDASYRIYFANLLVERGLYTEALDEFKDIKSLKLNSEERTFIKNKIDAIEKKLMK